MPITSVRGSQVRDGAIQRIDVDKDTPGNAMLRKVIQGAGIQITADGADAGTGDATISLAAIIPLGQVTTLYIGSKARFVALANGIQLEVQNSGGTWIVQNQWIEA
jgi:hypothetical protein